MREFRDIMRDDLRACALRKSEAHSGYGLFESKVTFQRLLACTGEGPVSGRHLLVPVLTRFMTLMRL